MSGVRHADLLTDRTESRLLLMDFDDEFTQILNMHRYLVKSSNRDFNIAYDRFLESGNPENYDGGDAIWDAENELGINPWDVESHAGLMAITRCVSLCEVMFARMAASQLKNPEHWVFPNGQSWVREWERLFYKTVLTTPFLVDGNGFGALRDLRDLYVHGYGVPATESRREKLAHALWGEFDTTKIRPDEEALGYEGEVYFFGDRTTYSSATRTLEGDAFSSRRADVSALATYRLLLAMRDHVHDGFAAVHGGFRSGLTDATCKFVKVVNAWWAKQPAGAGTV